MREAELDYLRIVVLAEDTAKYSSKLLGHHGLSYLLEAKRGSVTQHIIVDVGQSPHALRHNADLLGVNLSDTDMVVLTHCHYDHTVGLAALLLDMGKKEVPVVGHPDSFRLNFVTDPHIILKGMAWEDRESSIESSGGRLFLTKDPLELMPGLSTTGEVPRVTDYEDVGSALWTIKDGRLEKDEMLDDISVVARVKGHGLILLTGCSHAGIVNIMKHVETLYPGEAIEGVIGGFHLVQASDERISRTVDAMAEYGPKWVTAGHCTGFRAQVALSSRFGTGFTPMYVGQEVIID